MDKNIFSVIIVVILIASVLIGIPAYNKIQRNNAIEANRYNGFDFTPAPEGNLTTWKTIVSIQGKQLQLQFYHHPRELVNVSLESGITDDFINLQTRPQKLYITLPNTEDGPTLVVAGVEISKITGYQVDLFNIETKSALQTTVNRTDVSVVDCLQATENATVISFHPSEFNIITRDLENPHCLRFGYRTPRDAIKVADRFSYSLLQVMP